MILGILAPGGCGATFLDWTINYLSGNDQQIILNLDYGANAVIGVTKHDLCTDPLHQNNAHAHLKNHPNDINIGSCLTELRKQPCNKLHSFYFFDSFHNGHNAPCHQELIISNHDVKFIEFIISAEKKDHLFCLQVEKIKYRLQSWISEAGSNLDLNNRPWEARELLALYYPHSLHNQIKCVDQNYHNLKQLDWDDFLLVSSNLLSEIFDFIDLPLRPDRVDNWRHIYQRWQKTLSLDFFQDLPDILDAIVNNRTHDLSRYDMTFAKEVVIESLLLRRHNLSLKSFGIYRMPLDTRDWHQLLEYNIYHAVQ